MDWCECMQWTCKTAGREGRQQISHTFYEERSEGSHPDGLGDG